MFTRLTVKLTRFALSRADLSIKDRNLLTTLILNRLVALPLRDIINVNEEGTLLVNGRRLDGEHTRQLQASARAATKNAALRFIMQQATFVAISEGVHKAETPEAMYFSRAAIWFGQQVDTWLTLLAKDPTERELAP